MIGKNTLVLNKASIVLLVQEYLDKHAKDMQLKVDTIRFSGQECMQVDVVSEPRPQDNAASDFGRMNENFKDRG